MINAIFSRWVRSDNEALGESVTTTNGVTVSPPARRTHDSSILQSILRWLPGDSDPWGPGKAQAFQGKLPELRADFLRCIDDADAHDKAVSELKRNILRSRSLRDFWHLRSCIYTAVARTHSQWEAEQRLARLNKHFPLKPMVVSRGRHSPRAGASCN